MHLVAVCSGGRTLAKIMSASLKRKRIKTGYYEVWTNMVNGRSRLWKTDFTKGDYTGTAVIVEDVVWSGRQLPPIKRMLRIMDPKKKFYIASLFDCNHKADFAVYR